MKVEVPEEFTVFLENAVNILDTYESQGKDVVAITADMAKFQYYLRGRMDELKDAAISITNQEAKDYLGQKVVALDSLNREISTIYTILMDKIHANPKRDKR